MNRKYCESCKRYSYSAATFGNWTCPYCQRDLTHAELLVIPASYQAPKKEKQPSEPIPFRRKING